MRLSPFNLYVGDHPEPGTTLVYNTLTGSFAEVPSEIVDLLKRPHDPEAQAALAEVDLTDLADARIVSESAAAEEQVFREWHERQRSDTSTLEAIVSITFACNFDCTYCCQSDVLDGRTMKEATAEATARWLAARAQEIGARRIKLVFVGGEPLLHPGRIEHIVDRVKRLAPDVELIFTLITNGLFLTRELVARWRPIGLTGAQVTLDGDERTHGLTRRSKKGDDTFATIFKNVVEVADLITVNINGNYTPATSHGFVPLLRKLRAAGLAPGTQVFFSPALEALGAPSDASAASCTWSGSMPELMLTYHDEATRNGFDWGDLVAIGPCAFHTRHHYSVDPEGYLYKCPGFLGKPEWAVGTVDSGLNARYQRLANANPQRECGSCAHRPHCAGGCVASEWLRAGRAEGVNCEIGFFEQHGDALLKRKYALATADDPVTALAPFAAPASENPTRPVILHREGRVALRVLAA